MALSGDSLDALVKPGMEEEWEDVKKSWFPRTDTAENRAYDKRTPGKIWLKETVVIYNSIT